MPAPQPAWYILVSDNDTQSIIQKILKDHTSDGTPFPAGNTGAMVEHVAQCENTKHQIKVLLSPDCINFGNGLHVRSMDNIQFLSLFIAVFIAIQPQPKFLQLKACLASLAHVPTTCDQGAGTSSACMDLDVIKTLL